MKLETKLRHSFSLVDLTPLVDVVFLMLIFFVITSSILPLKSLSIQSPELRLDTPALTTQIVVVMDHSHVIYLGQRRSIIDLTTAKEEVIGEIKKLQERHPGIEPTLVLHVDERVNYGSFLKLFTTLQECCPHIRLVYETIS